MCSSWSVVSCSLNVDLSLSLTGSRVGAQDMEANLQVGELTHSLTRVYTCTFSEMCSGCDVVVPGGTEGVGAADPGGCLSDRWEEAAEGVGAECWTGTRYQRHCTDVQALFLHIDTRVKMNLHFLMSSMFNLCDLKVLVLFMDQSELCL